MNVEDSWHNMRDIHGMWLKDTLKKCFDEPIPTSIYKTEDIKVHPIVSWFSPYEICAYCKSSTERSASTSGGVCARLAELSFMSNGIVYGAAYTRDFKQVH